ncbi:MAG: LemA family protein [Candidatus Saccharimonas sp.]
MKSKWFVPGIIVAALLLVSMMLGGTYNSLVANREKVTKAASDLQSQYQRRADLVQQAIGVVKGSSTFEQDTLTKVIEARAKATSNTIDISKATPEQIQQYQAAQTEMSSSFSRLLVTVEQYPDIKSTQAYKDMLAQVEGTENRVNVARTDYNEVARQYNTQIQRFPTNIVAGLFGFTKSNYFESEKGVEKAPVIDFTN